jgi:hypothetical protein
MVVLRWKQKVRCLMAQNGEFPKYLMTVNGVEQYMSLVVAVAAYGDDRNRVEFGRYVREEGGNVRLMDEVDQERIRAIARSGEYEDEE